MPVPAAATASAGVATPAEGDAPAGVWSGGGVPRQRGVDAMAAGESGGAGVREHLVGLLLGTEQDWPRAYETLAGRLGTITAGDGSRHRLRTERVTIEPFSLRDRPAHQLVIDRLAYWYYHPREWLKKIALMDDVYLLNSPFTFQSMEKHAAYCAMMRLGLHVPETVLVPYKNPVDHAKWAYTAERYNRPFDLDAVAERLGYPLFMKPYDGGAWVGVSRVADSEQLHAAYDQSGERLMHLQQSVEHYDVFTRSLSVGPETMVMKFRPSLPMHERYEVAHGFLTDEVGDEVVTISRLVNAFFRWEFNSCECLVRDGVVYPIDYANACPDVALTSLHYYFPWAMTALLRWSAFCVVTGRRPRLDMDSARYFEIGDNTPDYREKLRGYRALADEYFDVDRYREFCDTTLRHVPGLVAEWVASAEFDDLLVSTVRATYPEHEHERFIAHFRGLVGQWRHENGPS
ncbi:ATP-grasp domain-containing protein [Dactylosporangium sp. CA-139114]|uniref:ATP-grasp domain-containing protein n=1 Tax=Dactylosporangium sp. CA-139114 TaxID=3239931 RepID=UPI003D99D56A